MYFVLAIALIISHMNNDILSHMNNDILSHMNNDIFSHMSNVWYNGITMYGCTGA